MIPRLTPLDFRNTFRENVFVITSFHAKTTSVLVSKIRFFIIKILEMNILYLVSDVGSV
ncbi:hypothetical protein [Chryseobacterium sp. MMS23-Vi53]|uniref:hypothetical protein n=1 Tax=Chryseobacterium sp. MMS23-Vi53 TaxID=3386644 RepID=UPI0039EC096E